MKYLEGSGMYFEKQMEESHHFPGSKNFAFFVKKTIQDQVTYSIIQVYLGCCCAFIKQIMKEARIFGVKPGDISKNFPLIFTLLKHK